MLRTMLKSKIHSATVTRADTHHAGSLTVDADLMEAADLLPGERVSVVDATNGARLETYVVPGERGSGVLGVNGAAAHLVGKGDLVIVTSYAAMEDEAARSHRPRVVFVDGANRPVSRGDDPADDPADAPAGAPDGSGPASGALLGGPTAGEQPTPVPSSETDDAARLDALIQAEA